MHPGKMSKYMDLVRFDLTLTINALFEMVSLLQNRRLFMKTYLVGKDVLRASGMHSRSFKDYIKDDVRIIDYTLNGIKNVLKNNQSFGSTPEILSNLEDLVDPAMSKLIMYEVKETANKYRYIYETHLDLAHQYKEKIFESLAFFAHFLKQLF
ncbi:hypothetical protein RB195_012893 [Necator americanus]